MAVVSVIYQFYYTVTLYSTDLLNHWSFGLVACHPAVICM